MYHMTMILADTILVADGNLDNNWKCVFRDALTGKSHEVIWTADQLAIVLHCALTGNGEGLFPGAYDQAAELVVDFPSECRPIP